ncbi:MAG: tripartite tricarboxylate transporter permease [Peptococcaceae bacterium]|nr:tripartite tricarboxylate transporter permease [Peptococcaceae bacterium]
MDGLEQLFYGFSIALTPMNLLWALIGVTVGTIIGVLPGVGPVTGIAVLLPLTFGRDPASALILLAGIYYGAMYGGSTTSILANIPGESSSVMTAVEGYELAKKGRGGAALGIAAFGSFIAGTVGLVLLGFLAPTMAKLAIKFGPPEYFTLMTLSFTLVAALSTNNIIKGLISTVIGLMVSTIGIDRLTGEARFTFGVIGLMDGIEFVVVAIGLFAVAEILCNLEVMQIPITQLKKFKVRELLPSKSDWKESIFPILRGSLVGFGIGCLPGGGATIGTFITYGIEKAISKTKEKFGTGHMPAVAAVESSNNGSAAGGFIPLLTLGIPAGGSTAVLLGGFMLLGISPGPTLFQLHPDVVWGLIASMYIGNVMLLILNLPLISLFMQILRLPYAVMSLFICVLSVLGIYSLSNSLFSLWIMLLFGVLGYVMRKLDFPLPPLLLGTILGGMMEEALRQSLSLSEGSWLIFFQRPISLTLSAIFCIVTAFQVYHIIKHGAYKERESDEA